MYLSYFDDAEIDLEVMLEINSHGLDLVNHSPFYSVVDMRNVFGVMDNEAKEFVANNKELNDLKIIEILLINNLPLRILAKGYLRINKPKTETIIIKSIDQLKKVLQDIDPQIQGIVDLENYLKAFFKT